ncbi:MAG TPA: hypothetical protein VFI47_06835 [Acidimicrobiales bacterium]|nr:hypothetical protein [Acidimicrobiales bacterium]
MTLRDYAATGGIGGAIEGTAQRIYDDLDEAGRELVRQVFLRLVHVEPAVAATRRVARLSELLALDGPAPPGAPTPGGDSDSDEPAIAVDPARVTVTAILERFVDVRLLTAQESTVALTHDSLLRAWPRLTAWIDEDRDAFGMQRGVTEATLAWEEADRDPDQLARGLRLEAMRTWVASAPPRMQLNQNEQEFVASSSRAAVAVEAAQRRQTRRLRTRLAVVSVAALVAGSLALGFNQARHDTAVARDEALSREIAVKAETLRSTDPTLAAQLALAGYEISATTEARSALLGSSAVAASTRYLGGEGSTALGVSPGVGWSR